MKLFAEPDQLLKKRRSPYRTEDAKRQEENGQKLEDNAEREQERHPGYRAPNQSRPEQKHHKENHDESRLVKHCDDHAGKSAYEHIHAEATHVNHLNRLSACRAGRNLGEEKFHVR